MSLHQDKFSYIWSLGQSNPPQGAAGFFQGPLQVTQQLLEQREGGARSLWIQAWLASPPTRLCLPLHSFSITPIVRVKAELCGFCDVPFSWRVVSGKLPPNQQPFQSVRCGKLLTLSKLGMTTTDRGGEGRGGEGVCAGLIPSLLVMNPSKSYLQSYLLMERCCL